MFIPEFNSLTKDDIAFVTESAATNKSLLKLRFPHETDTFAPVLELDVPATGEPIKTIKKIIYFIFYNSDQCFFL